jgi:hypothetical protein
VTREYHADDKKHIHRTRWVRAYGLEARIDVQIAPLIRECWLAGIVTLSSCQNFDGQTWIAFPTEAAFVEFRRRAKPRGLEVRSSVPPDLWTLGIVYNVFFPIRECAAAVRRLQRHNRRIRRPAKGGKLVKH